MTQLPSWLDYAGVYAAIFSSVVIGIGGLVFTYLQWKFAKDQPKRDLEAHQRVIRMAKQERLIGDFAIILRHSIAQKTYMDLQMAVIPGKDPEEQEKQLLNYLYAESEGLSLAMARARLEGVDQEILKIGNEQFKATGEFVTFQKLLFNRIDKQDGSDLTYLSSSVKDKRIFAIQKCEELEVVLKKKLDELENPKAV